MGSTQGGDRGRISNFTMAHHKLQQEFRKFLIRTQGRIRDSPRRGANPPGGGRQHTNLLGFPKKLREIKKILGRRGPLGSATGTNRSQGTGDATIYYLAKFSPKTA